MSLATHLVQRSKDIIDVAGLNMLGEFVIGSRLIELLSASVAPTQANGVIHVRIGYSYKQSSGVDGSIDMVTGLARRYRPVVLPYSREIQGPGTLYAAVLSEVSGIGNPFTFNVAYKVIK